MAWAQVQTRVKRLRRGCAPTYGTVVEVLNADEDGRHWLRVRWDHGVTCMAHEGELTRVKRESPARPLDNRNGLA